MDTNLWIIHVQTRVSDNTDDEGFMKPRVFLDTDPEMEKYIRSHDGDLIHTQCIGHSDVRALREFFAQHNENEDVACDICGAKVGEPCAANCADAEEF